MAKVSEIINLMEFIAPSWMACSGDVNGLQAGSPADNVSKVLLALDATSKTIDYAVDNGYSMIVTHHPRFYHPLKNLCRDTFSGNLAYKICKHDIALYNAHTNFDIVPGGVNDTLADIIGLSETMPLDPLIRDELLKLTIYVDEDHIDELKSALCEAGAGELGNYTDCAYKTIGIGCFKPLENAKPYCGRAGELYESEEWRLEVVLPRSLKSGIERILCEVHPYEQPAYDFTAIDAAQCYGLGRIGILPRALTVETIARKYKKAVKSRAVQILDCSNKPVKKLAVWSGSGVNVSKTVASGAECLVCGELGYHDAEVLAFYDVSVIILGHCPCEEMALLQLKQSLESGIEGVTVDLAPRFSPDFKSI